MKTFVAVPCMDQVSCKFAQSLANLDRVGLMSFNFSESSLVYDSRNKLAQAAVGEGSDYVLWLDSDMVFKPSLLRDLMDAIEGRDFVTAIAFRRRPPFTPALWAAVRMGLDPSENLNAEFAELPEGVFEIEGSGLACCLMRTEIIKAVIDKYHAVFDPLPGYGEDISFCIRARGCGYKLHAASGIRVGHMAQTIVTEDTWRAWNGGEHNA